MLLWNSLFPNINNVATLRGCKDRDMDFTFMVRRFIYEHLQQSMTTQQERESEFVTVLEPLGQKVIEALSR